MAQAIGSKTLTHTGKHYYGNMAQFLNMNLPAKNGRLFAGEANPTAVEYWPGMLPQTDDIVERTVALSVGVTDPGLGTDFGINILTEEQDILEKALEFERLTAHVLAG